jgi:hypothetical protein
MPLDGRFKELKMEHPPRLYLVLQVNISHFLQRMREGKLEGCSSTSSL